MRVYTCVHVWPPLCICAYVHVHSSVHMCIVTLLWVCLDTCAFVAYTYVYACTHVWLMYVQVCAYIGIPLCIYACVCDLFMCVYAHMCIPVTNYMHVCTRLCICMNICTSLCMHECVYISVPLMYWNVYICTSLGIYMCANVYMYIPLYVYGYAHMYNLMLVHKSILCINVYPPLCICLNTLLHPCGILVHICLCVHVYEYGADMCIHSDGSLGMAVGQRTQALKPRRAQQQLHSRHVTSPATEILLPLRWPGHTSDN